MRRGEEDISTGVIYAVTDCIASPQTRNQVEIVVWLVGAPDQADENDTLGQMIDECGIIKPSNDMEEGEKTAECQERIINKTDATSTTEGND